MKKTTKSMRLLKSLCDINEQLKKHYLIDWNYWKHRELRIICNYFIEKKWIDAYEDEITQWRKFEYAVTDLYNNKENVIKFIVYKDQELKTYLQTHSVFKVDTNAKGDWLNQLMIEILDVTPSDIELAYKSDPVPQDILDKLAMFDPEPIGLEVDPIRIEYDFWGFGGPIRVIETDWEIINKDPVDVGNFLSQYQPINIPNSFTAQEFSVMDSDLPF